MAKIETTKPKQEAEESLAVIKKSQMGADAQGLETEKNSNKKQTRMLQQQMTTRSNIPFAKENEMYYDSSSFYNECDLDWKSTAMKYGMLVSV